jgi:glycosyltransferase involved in cell wall biosynthesis
VTRKKIAILLSRFPYPLDKGDKLRAYHQIKFIAQYHDVFLYALTEEKIKDEWLNELKPFCKEMKIFYLNKWQILMQSCVAICKGYPLQVGYFFNPTIKILIDQEIAQLNPDTVYCQLSRTALYVNDLPYKKVIDFQDAFSMNYARIQKQESGFKKIFYAWESKRMQAFEKLMLQWFDACTIISAFDKANISIQPNKLEVVANGVDSNYFKPMQAEKKYDLLFLGNLSYLPNKNAVQYLVEKIMPLLSQRKANIKVNIAGGNTLSENSSTNTPQIHYSGWVKDSRVAYAETVLFVAPLFTGAGLQNKLLEAMSMGIPCIATSIANASLHAKPNEEIMIADSAEAFVDCILYLLENEEKRRELQINASKFIQDNYTWESVNEKLLACL